MSDEILNIIIKNKERIIVQIDLHSMNDEYLKWFTKVSNTVDRIKKNIIKLSENEVLMRVATMVTPRNLDEVEDIAEWVHRQGIKKYGVSPILEMAEQKILEMNCL